MLNSKTVAITLLDLVTIIQCLSQYRNRFKSVLKGINHLYLAYLVKACKSLAEYCQSWAKGKSQNSSLDHELLLPSALASDLKLDQLPVRELDAWIKNAKVARKVSGYSESLAAKADKSQGAAHCFQPLCRLTI